MTQQRSVVPCAVHGIFYYGDVCPRCVYSDRQTHLADPDFRVDIEIYTNYGDGYWAQARFLVHSMSDVLWTNDLESALNFLRAFLEEAGGDV